MNLACDSYGITPALSCLRKPHEGRQSERASPPGIRTLTENTGFFAGLSDLAETRTSETPSSPDGTAAAVSFQPPGLSHLTAAAPPSAQSPTLTSAPAATTAAKHIAMQQDGDMDISTPPCHCLSQHSITGISTAGLTTGSSMPPMTPNCSPSAASASGGLARNLISEPSCRNCAYSTLSMKATGR